VSESFAFDNLDCVVIDRKRGYDESLHGQPSKPRYRSAASPLCPERQAVFWPDIGSSQY
jgi:hypothetical protein